MAFLAVGVQVPPSARKFSSACLMRPVIDPCRPYSPTCPPSPGIAALGRLQGSLFRLYPLLCVLSIGLTGCARPSPERALDAIMQAAESGDMEGFLQGLTPESRHIQEGLQSILVRGKNPLALGSYAHTVRAIQADVEGELAYVMVQTNQEPVEAAILVLRLVEDKWRLDMVETELLWNSKWVLSGGSPRSLPDGSMELDLLKGLP